MARDKEKWAAYMREYNSANNEKVNARRRELRRENPEKYRERDKKRYKRNPLRTKLGKYGLNKEDYLAMLGQQDNRCAICGSDMKQVNIDHCHDTGKVRGLLCTACNTGVGKLKDDITILQSAIEYLSKYSEE